MKNATRIFANQLSEKIQKFTNELQDLKGSQERQKSPTANELQLLCKWGNGNYTTFDKPFLLSIQPDVIVELYVMRLERHIADLQTSLDNLTDENCPQPRKKSDPE